MKICRKCGEEKADDLFEKNRRKCKNCRRIQGNINHGIRAKNPEYAKKMRIKARLWNMKNPEKVSAMKKKSRKSNPPPDPYKFRARYTLSNAVASGRIHRPSICEDCGWEGKIEGHHEDYNKPLEVIWLCKICHGKRHRKYKD
jgi:hypothetical protein